MILVGMIGASIMVAVPAGTASAQRATNTTMKAYNLSTEGNENWHDGYADGDEWYHKKSDIIAHIAQVIEDSKQYQEYISADNWAKLENFDASKIKYIQDAENKLAEVQQIHDSAASAKQAADEEAKRKKAEQEKAAQEQKQKQESTAQVTEKANAQNNYYADNDWFGGKLTRSGGVFYRSDGIKETFYNLSMNNIIANAKAMGIAGDYAVRADGVKTYGGYVIVAVGGVAKGTIVSTSLGTGIVLDSCPTPGVYDIAVTW